MSCGIVCFLLTGDVGRFQEVSSLSVESCDGEFLIVTVFEIRKEEVWLFFCLIFEIWRKI